MNLPISPSFQAADAAATLPPEAGTPPQHRRSGQRAQATFAVEQVSIGALRPDPANPRRIAEAELEHLERSIRQFGLVQPLLARREDHVLIGGHQRLLAARRLGLRTVPVIFLDLPGPAAHLLSLALNRVGGEWDEPLLAQLLAELGEAPALDLSLSGFEEDEIGALLRSLETREKEGRAEAFDLDEALEEVRGRGLRTQPGELWALGEHRLLVGDATDPAAVARLLAGAEPRLLVTDPPYGVSLEGRRRDPVQVALRGASGRRTAGFRHTSVAGDTRADWSAAFELVPSLAVGYVWHAALHAPEVAAGLERIGFEIVSQVIWDKTLFTPGHAWYHWGHEPCFVVRKRGASLPFRGPRDQGTVWRVPSPKMLAGGSREPKLDHPTQKPEALFAIPMRNHLRPGDAVYDPFLGSGTCLIAAERLGVRCYGMEIDPLYGELILRRWERFSDDEAARIDG